MFNISEKAALEINRLLVEEGDTDSFLRIKVVPGGCSGGINGTGFGVENPNAKATCGCGTSFTV